MASYGRNFDFRVPPHGGQRSGRFVLTNSNLASLGHTGAGLTSVPIGAPVGLDTAYTGVSEENFTNASDVKLIYSATNPVSGIHGILVYEHAPAAYAGDDPFLTTWSDKDTAPVGKLVQVVSGRDVKVVLKNTSDRTFLNTRTYTGRTMVAGIGQSTPTLVVGDYLTPGAGTDTGGYWAEGNSTNGWLVITAVDNDRAEVEARFTF